MLPGGTRIAVQHDASSANVPLMRRKRYSAAPSMRGGLTSSTGAPPGPTVGVEVEITGAGNDSAKAGAPTTRHVNATATGPSGEPSSRS